MIAYPCNKGANQLWGLVARGGAVGLTNALDSPPLCLNTEIGNSPDKATSYVIMAMRIANYVRNGPPPSGYTLRVSASVNARYGAAFNNLSIITSDLYVPLLILLLQHWWGVAAYVCRQDIGIRCYPVASATCHLLHRAGGGKGEYHNSLVAPRAAYPS